MSGITGNKGTIGVRCFYGNHPLCFLCSHMAAGQENVTIRNREYWTTFQESIFPSGSTIKDHDVIIWSGDFNYRLDMSVDAATSWLQAKDYSQLLMFCQVSGKEIP